ncbi:MAG: hypothetical protein JXA73_07370 [Acidobacteria bacterium]|nr:hypothetical protein [Acidobacteriota bacterium]
MENVCVLEEKISVRKFVLRVLASGIFMMALDLFLNAGMFAKVWLEPSPFLLEPGDLFRRIPLGYIAFFLQAWAWVWLTIKVGVRTWKQGCLFGLKFGSLLAIAATLGLRSGTTAGWPMLLAGYLVGNTVLTTGACLMAGLSSQRSEKRALWSAILALVVAFILIVILQNTGLAPAQRMN